MAITGKRVKTTTSKCWCELHIGNKGWWRGQDAAFKHLIARLVGQKGRAEKGKSNLLVRCASCEDLNWYRG